MAKREVVLRFDEAAYQYIQEVKRDRGYSTVGEVVSDSLRIQKALRSEKGKGYRDILVHDPRTHKTKILHTGE